MATPNDILKILHSWIGMDRAKGTHKPILDIYNAHKPLARGYKVKLTDEYCATTISAAFIKADSVRDIGGTECSVEKFIDIFKKEGIWEEDGKVTPKLGDIICYNWDDNTQPNDGRADHIGMVSAVKGNMIFVIEGNKRGRVDVREIRIGSGYIRGYARPKYSVPAPPDMNDILKIAQEVIDGKWGDGENRRKRLRDAGFNPNDVQTQVNNILRKK